MAELDNSTKGWAKMAGQADGIPNDVPYEVNARIMHRMIMESAASDIPHSKQLRENWKREIIDNLTEKVKSHKFPNYFSDEKTDYLGFFTKEEKENLMYFLDSIPQDERNAVLKEIKDAVKEGKEKRLSFGPLRALEDFWNDASSDKEKVLSEDSHRTSLLEGIENFPKTFENPGQLSGKDRQTVIFSDVLDKFTPLERVKFQLTQDSLVVEPNRYIEDLEKVLGRKINAREIFDREALKAELGKLQENQNGDTVSVDTEKTLHDNFERLMGQQEKESRTNGLKR